MNENEVFPNNEQVKDIFKFTYLFFQKWITVKNVDWGALMADVRMLEKKYPFELCRKILVELVSIIETSYMGRSEIDGA